jgi:tetratricopeptide (TPR) repeat protein
VPLSPRVAAFGVVFPVAIIVGFAIAAAVGRLRFSDTPGDALAADISKRFAELDIKPSTADFTYKKGLALRTAVRGGDFVIANEITNDVVSHSQIENWRYHPFENFIAAAFATIDPALEPRLTEWIAKEPVNATPLLLRAQYYYTAGWAKRGHNFAQKTDRARMGGFVGLMAKALADINAAIRLDDHNPYSFYLRLRILEGDGLSKEFASTVEDAVGKYPTYYPLYEIALSTLQPRWGGNIPAMYAFVDKYAEGAPEFSPRKLLYLRLYQLLLSTSSVSCTALGRDRDKTADCIRAVMQTAVQPRLEQQVLTALQLYDHTDHYQFGIAVKPIVDDMLHTTAGETYAGAALQLAASSMHSDTQLKEDKPESQNNYVVDELVAESWHEKGFYQNEVSKYQEALSDARGATFPSEEEKDLAIAFIYEELSEAAGREHQYVDEIAFEQAAVTLGVTWDEHYVCYGYYQLKRYAEAATACTAAIDSTGNPNARYWRGRAYQQAGMLDEALRDLADVADAETQFAASAAIEASMIYFKRNDNQGALNLLNKYTFLYDPNRTTKADVAVSYNNRCYAHMQLEELPQALDDCTESLKYGSIPDAFRKQQELVKRLGAQGKGL